MLFRTPRGPPLLADIAVLREDVSQRRLCCRGSGFYPAMVLSGSCLVDEAALAAGRVGPGWFAMCDGSTTLRCGPHRWRRVRAPAEKPGCGSWVTLWIPVAQVD